MMAGQRDWLRAREQAAHIIGKHRGRNAHRKCRGERARDACDGIADQGDDQDVRARRQLGNRDRRRRIACRSSSAAHRPRCDASPGMAALAPPTANSDIRPNVKISVQPGWRRNSCRSPPAHENRDGDADRDRHQKHRLQRQPHNPDGDEYGDQQDEPTTSRRLISGIIIRNTTAIKSPTAAQETPARMRRSASTSP